MRDNDTLSAEQQDEAIKPIDKGIQALGYELQLELDDANAHYESLVGLGKAPRQTFMGWAVQSSKDAWKKVFCFLIG